MHVYLVKAGASPDPKDTDRYSKKYTVYRFKRKDGLDGFFAVLLFKKYSYIWDNMVNCAIDPTYSDK